MHSLHGLLSVSGLIHLHPLAHILTAEGPAVGTYCIELIEFKLIEYCTKKKTTSCTRDERRRDGDMTTPQKSLKSFQRQRITFSSGTNYVRSVKIKIYLKGDEYVAV